MEYVSVAMSRAGWHPGDETPKKKAVARKKRAAKKATAPKRKATPQTSVEPTTANTNPDGHVPVSQSEEG